MKRTKSSGACRVWRESLRTFPSPSASVNLPMSAGVAQPGALSHIPRARGGSSIQLGDTRASLKPLVKVIRIWPARPCINTSKKWKMLYSGKTKTERNTLIYTFDGYHVGSFYFRTACYVATGINFLCLLTPYYHLFVVSLGFAKK